MHHVDTHIRGLAIKNRIEFFCFPVKLAIVSCVLCRLIFSTPFTVKISRLYGKQFGSCHCLKWIVFLFSVRIMLSVNAERRINVKFCVNLGKSATETYHLLKKVDCDECLSHTQVFEWFRRFKEGREEIGDDQCPGRPSTAKTEANIEKNRWNCSTKSSPEHSSNCWID